MTTAQPVLSSAGFDAPGNLAAQLADLAERRGWVDRPAFHQGHRAWTHGEVHALAARAATVLAGHGIGPGDRVVLALPDGIAWVTAFLAVARLGAVAVLVNPELPAADHAFMATDAGAALCVTGPGLEDRFAERPRLGSDQLLALTASAEPAPAHRVDAHTPLYVQYTSGTTGRPKGVVHTHGDPKAYHDLIGRRLLRVGQDDVTLSVSKLYFAYGFGNAFVFPLFSGSSAVLVDRRPTPAAVDELIARHRVTLLYSVPSAYAALVADRGSGHEACFASVRAAVSAGEGLPEGLGGQVTELLGAPVLEQIGSTEAGHAFCANSFGHNRPGTVGRPVPGFEVELRDRAGHPVPDGTEGELWVRGPTVTPAISTGPRRPNAPWSEAGWPPVTGRFAKPTAPTGIWAAPTTWRWSAASPSPAGGGGRTAHPPGGEGGRGRGRHRREGVGRLRAFVVPVAPVPDGSLQEDLLGLARAQLAAFKVPRSVSLVPSLPRTPTGKLRRHLVRRGAW